MASQKCAHLRLQRIKELQMMKEQEELEAARLQNEISRLQWEMSQIQAEVQRLGIVRNSNFSKHD
jgi:hypothetical protein